MGEELKNAKESNKNLKNTVGEKDDEIKKLKEKSHDVDHLENEIKHLKEENERLKNRPMPEEEDENFNKVTTQQKKSKSKPPENDRPPANDEQIEKLKVELKDKTKERSNLCWLLALLCGKIFLLGDDSNKQEDDDRFNKLQIKYNTQVKQYSLLETDMKNAKYQHGRLLTEAKTAEEKSKQHALTQTNYYKKKKLH